MDSFKITLTEEAAVRVKELMAEEFPDKSVHLRVWVAGGGCSGLTYGMGLDDTLDENDDIYKSHDVNIVIDHESMEYMNGSVIEWDSEVFGGGFKVENPNAQQKCGCGSSFTVDGVESNSGCGGCSLKDAE